MTHLMCLLLLEYSRKMEKTYTVRYYSILYILQQGNLENGHSELTNGSPTATLNPSPSKKNGTKSKTAKFHTNKHRQVVEEKRKALREYMQRAAGMKYLIERNRLK